jgi:diguanylate cyclase (GGDEF)-like protein
MRRGERKPRPVFDPELRAVLPSLPVGVVTTLLIVAAAIPYLLSTWSEPNRGVMMVILAIAGISVLPLLFVAPERLLGRRDRRNAFFVSWTAMDAVFVATVAILDGGISSPFTVTLFLTQAFSAVFYPPRLVIISAAGNLVALAAIAVLGDSHALTATLFEAAALIGTSVMCAWAAINAAAQRRELAHASRSDPLTGCLNRLGLEERLGQEVARAERTVVPFAMVVVDLDDFKRVNDDHGHAAGDALLREIVITMAEVVRGMDSLGRLGGDEFALVFPDVSPAGIPVLVERVQRAVAQHASCSLGAASYPKDADSADQIMVEADHAMYRNKRRAAQADRDDQALTGNALV